MTILKVAALQLAFTDRVEGVPEGAWDAPAPCEGWVARDVVRHLCDWIPGLFAGAYGLPAPGGPSVDDDPVGAFTAVRDQMQADLSDPAKAEQEYDGRLGRSTFGKSVDGFICFDLVVHGWDLSRATGQDETIDPADVARAVMYAVTQPPGVQIAQLVILPSNRW